MNNIIEIKLEKLYKENPAFGFKDMFTCKNYIQINYFLLEIKFYMK